YSLLHGRAAEADELRAELERVRKEAKKRPVAAASTDDAELVEERSAEAGGGNVVIGQARGLDPNALLDGSDRLKQRRAPAAVVLASVDNGNVHLVANFDESLPGRGVNAGDVIKAAAAHVGGGGGGRPTMARAGGKNPEKVADALAEAERLI